MIVIDASALIAGLTGGGPAREAMAADDLHAPHLAAVEVASGLRRLVASGDVDEAMGPPVLEILAQFGITWYPMVPHLARIWELRHNLSAFDATYVALAEALECGLFTADARLVNAPGVGCPVTVVPA